jgi:hypothetical protein
MGVPPTELARQGLLERLREVTAGIRVGHGVACLRYLFFSSSTVTTVCFPPLISNTRSSTGS